MTHLLAAAILVALLSSLALTPAAAAAPEVIDAQARAQAIALDKDLIVWLDEAGALRSGVVRDGRIVEEQRLGRDLEPVALAANRGRLFWVTARGALWMAPLTAERQLGERVQLTRSIDAVDVAVDGDLVVWINERGHLRLGQLREDGVDDRRTVNTSYRPRHVTVGHGRLWLLGPQRQLVTAAPGDRVVEVRRERQRLAARDIDLDREQLYWVDEDGRILRGLPEE